MIGALSTPFLSLNIKGIYMYDTDAICIYNMALTKNQQKKILSEMSASYVFTALDFTHSIVQLQNVTLQQRLHFANIYI